MPDKKCPVELKPMKDWVQEAACSQTDSPPVGFRGEKKGRAASTV